MKNILQYILAVVFLSACSQDFLDTEPLTKKVDANFYQTPEDAQLALTAIYATLTSVETMEDFFFVSELMSDHRFGGGRLDNQTYNAVSMFKKVDPNQYVNAWSTSYKGIFRANMLLQNIDQVEWADENQRKQVHGEALFLRAHIYFNLARMFGNIPLVLQSAPVNLPQAAPDMLYGQIAQDLKNAIETFPSTPFNQIPVTELGHATKWAAEGLMARVFLFYTGYYKKDSITLPDGGTVTKNDVIGWVDDCVNNSGHNLISDFRNLWPYAYANKDYGYARDNKLQWIGEEGANTETIFALKFSNHGSFETSVFYSNQVVLFFGLRDQAMVPLGQGWGAGTVNPQLWQAWPDEDIRKKGSILNVNPDWGETELDGVSGYIWGTRDQWQESGMWQKKYIPINVLDANGLRVAYSVELYGTTPNYQLENTQDLVLIRFADVLLMGAELGGPNAQAYMDRVRNRVGLSSVPATLENIKKERVYELSFECVRYWDLLRWGDAEKEFTKVVDVPVYNAKIAATTSLKFRPETGGFLPIPQSQIDLSEGVLKQNPGWEGTEAEF
jgi:starch-binding outer membrane protein, SusD/RagB family